MLRPTTSSTMVMGVDSTSPTGPHIAVQKAAAATTATGERPVLLPKNKGSSTWPTSSSVAITMPSVRRASVQPSPTAAAMMMGNTEASSVPT